MGFRENFEKRMTLYFQSDRSSRPFLTFGKCPNINPDKLQGAIFYSENIQQINIYLSGFEKRYLQKFQVHFNDLTLQVNKKQLKVASSGLFLAKATDL